ncbi:MAG: hypothetical protein ACR2RB_07310, partial [Gammaproteobacteria bacterium]
MESRASVFVATELSLVRKLMIRFGARTWTRAQCRQSGLTPPISTENETNPRCRPSIGSRLLATAVLFAATIFAAPGAFAQTDYGDAPDSYGTLAASTGASHAITAGLQLGATAPDADTDGFGDGVDDAPAGDAADDDTAGDPAGGVDDEDGVDIAAQPGISDADGGFVRRWTVDVVNT